MNTVTPHFLRSLDSRDGIEALGNKAANLAIVNQLHDVHTPRGFAIPGEVVDAYLEPFRPEITAILSAHNTAAAHRAIEELLLERPLAFSGELERFLGETFSGGTLFAVRSSAHPVVRGARLAEDSAGHSLAGQYESFLRVPRAQVAHAVTRCCASLFNARSIELFAPHLDSTYVTSTMTVVVQEMIEASASGVMMTMDPLAAREGTETIGIESSFGACEVIVSGQVQGDLYFVDRTSLSVTDIELGSKRWQLRLPLYGSTEHTVLEPVKESARRERALTDDEVLRLARVGLRIEELFGMPQDIEFVLDEGRRIVVTQARPITTLN